MTRAKWNWHSTQIDVCFEIALISKELELPTKAQNQHPHIGSDAGSLLAVYVSTNSLIIHDVVTIVKRLADKSAPVSFLLCGVNVHQSQIHEIRGTLRQLFLDYS
jgi:hypothetical protein